MKVAASKPIPELSEMSLYQLVQEHSYYHDAFLRTGSSLDKAELVKIENELRRRELIHSS